MGWALLTELEPLVVRLTVFEEVADAAAEPDDVAGAVPTHGQPVRVLTDEDDRTAVLVGKVS